jgi:hypothetical protein
MVRMLSSRWFLPTMAALGVGLASAAAPSGRAQEGWHGVLDEHPAIQYATRATTDPIARLKRALSDGGKQLTPDSRTGYLLPLLRALDIATESQILVFSKTGVQREYTGPQNPRALYFNESVIVGYVPGAPVIEIASHDPQQGIVFYVLDQSAPAPVISRRTACLSCHVSASTLNVPGVIARSNMVGEDGNLLPQPDTHDVNHSTSHPDRWGGWYVTSEGAPAPYSQRGHAGNITFTTQGNTSNQVFVEWMQGAPGQRPYPLASSDTVALLTFDHQSRAINLLTRLNWESRIAGASPLGSGEVRGLVKELAEYFLFVDEAPLPVPLSPIPAFAEHLRARTPKDSRGRSFAQLELVNRLLRYPCSFMVYSEAFDGLPRDVRQAVYQRMREVLAGEGVPASYARVSADDRRAVEEILRETKPDFLPQ